MQPPDECQVPVRLIGTKDKTVLCGAPCSIGWEWVDVSSGGLSPGARVNCAAGHWYTITGDEIQDPFYEEP